MGARKVQAIVNGKPVTLLWSEDAVTIPPIEGLLDEPVSFTFGNVGSFFRGSNPIVAEMRINSANGNVEMDWVRVAQLGDDESVSVVLAEAMPEPDIVIG